MCHTIGLHIRYERSIIELIEKCQRLKILFFQSFLRSSSGKILKVSEHEYDIFTASSIDFPYLFAHSWYTINLADHRRIHHPVLEHEIRLAEKLRFSHIIVHPGSAADKIKAIDAIARTLNKIILQSKICIVLENVPFGDPSIGGDLEDFKKILTKMDFPEKIGFCIDTAHAHSYGYDISTSFIDIIDKTVGVDHVKLIHLNNTSSMPGSRRDVHCRINGGTIPLEKLKAFVQDQRIADVPLVLELPELEEQEELDDLETVRNFFKK